MPQREYYREGDEPETPTTEAPHGASPWTTTEVVGKPLPRVDAYERLGEQDLAADTQRVVALNQEAGRFLSDEPAPGEVGLTRKIWDYLELDKN